MCLCVCVCVCVYLLLYNQMNVLRICNSLEMQLFYWVIFYIFEFDSAILVKGIVEWIFNLTWEYLALIYICHVMSTISQYHAFT